MVDVSFSCSTVLAWPEVAAVAAAAVLAVASVG